MKSIRYLIVGIGLLFLSISAIGQTKYYISEEGIVLDSLSYTALKQKTIRTFKSIFADKEVKIDESFDIYTSTKDSLIYAYKWDIRMDESDRQPEEEDNFEAVNTDELSHKGVSYLNKEFPIREFITFDNDTIRLDDLKGKPTLINFWFTACKPCIEEMPALNRIKTRFNDSVNFVAITFDTKFQVERFLQKRQFDFIHITDAKAITDTLNMKSFPVNMFLDKDGVIRRIESGIPYIVEENGNVMMSDGKVFVRYLQRLL